MTKVNLFKTLDEFYVSFANLNTTDSKEILNFKKKYADSKNKIDLLNLKTSEAIEIWKCTQGNFRAEPLDNSNPTHIHQKAKLIKNAAVALQIIAGMTAAVAFVSIVGSSLYLSALLLVLSAFSSVVTINLTRVKEILGVNTNIPFEPSIPSPSFYFKNIALVLNRMQIIRQNRMLNSKNYHRFIENFANTNSYKIEGDVLADVQLQSIYIKYKYAIKELINERGSVIRIT